jgi:hypothetical protein
MTIVMSEACTINVCIEALALARVVNYTPRVLLKIVASLTDGSVGIIYNRNKFIVQAT